MTDSEELIHDWRGPVIPMINFRKWFQLMILILMLRLYLLVPHFSILLVTNLMDGRELRVHSHEFVKSKKRREAHCFQLRVLLSPTASRKRISLLIRCKYFVATSPDMVRLVCFFTVKVPNIHKQFDNCCKQAICNRKTHARETSFAVLGYKELGLRGRLTGKKAEGTK